MIELLAIKPLFKNPDERQVGFLSQFYSDSEYLKLAIKELLSEFGFDLTVYNNKKILIKPNWVRHNIKPEDEICLTTHPRFILAVVDIVLEHKPSEVIIADAPIQGCIWDKLLPEYFYDEIQQKSMDSGIPIKILDWRRRVLADHGNNVHENIRPIENYVLFDVGTKSFLEPITTDKAQFRVTDYNPDRLAQSHSPGKHTYCIAKEVFEADYIIALPKAKTHQKSGITNALKLIVGLNGDKDFLPHHRVGGTGYGGDCYPGKNPVLRLSEHFLDMANRRTGSPYYMPLKRLSKITWRLVPKTPKHSFAAAWHGNDTTWRMVMDLNLIAKYGKFDGSLSKHPQRDILYICDAIIGGQGDGPLKPDPLPLGLIIASINPAIMDCALSRIMRFAQEKLPLIVNALSLFGRESSIIIDGNPSSFHDLDSLSIPTKAPPGWVDYLSLG